MPVGAGILKFSRKIDFQKLTFIKNRFFYPWGPRAGPGDPKDGIPGGAALGIPGGVPRGFWGAVRASRLTEKSKDKTLGVFFHAAFDFETPCD